MMRVSHRPSIVAYSIQKMTHRPSICPKLKENVILENEDHFLCLRPILALWVVFVRFGGISIKAARTH